MAAAGNNWYFTKDQIDNSPSRQCGIEADKELSYRQQAANFIQDMGQKLKVSQLCINTAIVYMHRFYVFHSFTNFPWHSIAAAAVFLAAKVEEQPRKLEYVIRIANHCKNPRDTTFDTTSERYQAQSQDLVFNENILLQTLGFDVAIDHPHTYVVKCCHLVKASKDLAQTSYFIASNSLHLTTMCLQYKPTVVACFCIHLVCKWSNWEIPLSNEKKQWFSYVDPTVTIELLQQLTGEFLIIYEKCPSRLKERILAIGESGSSLSHGSGHPSSPFEQSDKNYNLQEAYHSLRNYRDKSDDLHKPRPPRPPHEAGSSQQHRDREREYREKKERERIAYHSKSAVPGAPNKHVPHPHAHHTSHPPSFDHKGKLHAKPGHSSGARIEPRDVLRDAAKEKELHRDPHHPTKDSTHSEKREHAHTKLEVKPSDAISIGNSTDAHAHAHAHARPNHSEKRPEAPRKPPDPTKVQQKQQQQQLPAAAPPHDPNRKPYNVKLETDIKKHLNAAIQEKSTAYLQKLPPISTSNNKTKPFVVDTPKSVPLTVANIKTEPHNGTNSNGSNYNLPTLTLDSEIKPKLEHIQQEVPTHVKKPSLFSPEKTPPHRKTEQSPHIPVKDEVFHNFAFIEPVELVSPFGSPQNRKGNRSEPELRPVVKRIDQVQGFENIVRDTSIGVKAEAKDVKMRIPKLSSPREIKQEVHFPPTTTISLSQPIVNGIETNPVLISSLLKEAPPMLPLSTVLPTGENKEKDHHHKKSKKEKHRHKDKEKSKEEKEKKKRHKDKDKEKHRHKHKKHEEEVPAQPIKITIPKDKIQPPDTPSIGLKIKIPKERLKTESIGEPSVVASGGLKIKISKEVISNYTPEASGRKRERDKSPACGAPTPKLTKVNYAATKPNVPKNAYAKQVVQLGDGGTTIHRLAESKYSSRGTAS